MKIESLKYFSCPKCKERLILDRNIIEDEEVKNGKLKCSNCKTNYSIVNFIPRFCTNYNYAESFGLQWQRHRRIQIDKFNGYSLSRDRLNIAAGWPKRMEGNIILEVGSGAGRFTQILIETGAQIFSFDYSSAVDANLENNGLPLNLNLFQGDLHHVPLNYGMFDKILCLGVLQHTPNPKQAFMSLIPFLKSGGEIVIDIYKRTLSSMIHWKHILRPLLCYMEKERLYNYIRKIVPRLLPMAILLRKLTGPIGSRILPIANYSHLGIPKEMNIEWSILDTFDMYSPKYDIPKKLSEVKQWFEEAGLKQISVRYGPNGIIGKAIKK